MSRALVILDGPFSRRQAANLIMRAPVGSRCEVKGPTRSLDQNSLLWARLTEVARQLSWHGQKYTADDWKDFFLHSMRRARWMPLEDGGMVPIGLRSSDLSVGEMTELLDLIDAFGTQNGVVWSDPKATEPKELERA